MCHNVNFDILLFGYSLSVVVSFTLHGHAFSYCSLLWYARIANYDIMLVFPMLSNISMPIILVVVQECIVYQHLNYGSVVVRLCV